MYTDQEPLNGPLTLHQAMARAVKYNLEGRLKIMEEALAKRQLDLASFDMLPRMALSAGYAGATTPTPPAARVFAPAPSPWNRRHPRTATVAWPT